MITYPITFPDRIVRSYTLGYQTNILSYVAPDTFQTSTYEKVGKAWSLQLNIKPANIEEARAISATFTALKGPKGTFKWYVYKPTAKSLGTFTITSHNTLRDTIVLNSATNITVGDFLRVGSQLIQVLSLNGSTIDIFPSLRTNSVNATVYGNDVYGVFRLKANQQSWTMDVSKYTAFSVDAMEAV